MPIDVACPHCGHSYQVRDEAAGRQFKCKSCGDVVSVPGWALTDGVSPPKVSPVDGDNTTDGDQFAIPRRPFPDDAPSGGHVWLAKTSLILGCVVWCLVIVGFLALLVVGAIAAQQGGAPPKDEEMTTFAILGLAACGGGCLTLALSLVGGVFGVVALSNPAEPRGQAIGGLVLNGLFFVGAAILVLLSVVTQQL